MEKFFTWLGGIVAVILLAAVAFTAMQEIGTAQYQRQVAPPGCYLYSTTATVKNGLGTPVPVTITVLTCPPTATP